MSSRATLIVDGDIRLDDELEEWHRRPPAMLADMVKSGVKPEPWLMIAGWALADATAKGLPIRVIVDTKTEVWIDGQLWRGSTVTELRPA